MVSPKTLSGHLYRIQECMQLLMIYICTFLVHSKNPSFSVLLNSFHSLFFVIWLFCFFILPFFLFLIYLLLASLLLSYLVICHCCSHSLTAIADKLPASLSVVQLSWRKSQERPKHLHLFLNLSSSKLELLCTHSTLNITQCMHIKYFCVLSFISAALLIQILKSYKRVILLLSQNPQVRSKS